jgi:SAM-dependent methyltransferase
LSKTVEFVRVHGAGRFSACIFCKALFSLLRRVFRFDPWHASAPFPCREYKVQTSALANSLAPRVVVDIGCGLGEILSHIKSAERIGLDHDPQVLKAARFLYGSKIAFRTVSVFDAPAVASAIGNSEVDLAIMTNWSHGTPLPTLIETVKAVAQHVRYKYLIIDTVRPDSMAGAKCHSVAEIGQLGPVLRSVSAGDGIRDLHVLGPPSDLSV